MEASKRPRVTRFAPSPTGELHLGHAYSALCAFHRAEEAKGRFLLRMEDIDPGRCRPEFDAAIRHDLAWLGLTWEEPVRRQSEHFETYRNYLNVLEAKGLLYPCFCTRKEIAAEVAAMDHAPHGPDGVIYPGTCRALSAAERAERIAGGDAYALRLDMAAAMAQAGGPMLWHDVKVGFVTATPEIFGDVVLARKDSPTSYHLAVTVDDHLQGVSLVTRGEDLFEATHIHRLLQALFDFAVPDYDHHGLLTTPEGKRLAKRDKSLTLRALREAGHSPADVRKMAGL